MSTDHSQAEHEPANSGRPPHWIVWRQDDNGNRYEVTRKQSQADAEELAATMQARGHKQLYWVAQAPR